MHKLFALLVAVSLALTTATAHADELPIPDPPPNPPLLQIATGREREGLLAARQHRGRVKTITGSIFLAVGLTSLVVAGSFAVVGFRDRESSRTLFGEDGDLFATMFLAFGTAEAVVGTAVGVPLLAVGAHEQKPLASPTSVATIRF